MLNFTTSQTIPLSFAPSIDGLNEQHNLGASGGSPPLDSSMDEDSSPIYVCMLAGAFGGLVGDTSMHSLDTVKTRQQGMKSNKYGNMLTTYGTIFKQEGFFRGLYGGYTPALLGSIPSTATFFGTYEFSKRVFINDLHFNETITYLIAGVLGDLASSIFYVPSEVLKTRLQLQGKHNNPYTKESGYNYKGLVDAVRTISTKEGTSTFVFGYKETLFRDLPFSALQFAFYEKFRSLAIIYNKSEDLSIPLELLTGSSAGGLAGILTTPLDVIKTRIQTTASKDTKSLNIFSNKNIGRSVGLVYYLSQISIYQALNSVYKNEGIIGLFSGVGPRFIWTGVQSSIMLFLYQFTLKRLNRIIPQRDESF